ncbi:hypothetical protein DV738_g2362, partial [Chaetothyriales sp. CBS 135597]
MVQHEQSESLLPTGGEISQPPDSNLTHRVNYYLHEGRRRIFTRLVQQASPSQVYRVLKKVGYTLTPTLVRTLVWQEEAPVSKRFPTSYLNGLRGLTSLKVYTFHYTFAFSDFGYKPWGMDDRHKYLLELPIIRYFYAGFTSQVFFGIAGYLTALRLFQLLEKSDPVTHQKVFQNVSGSMFRRAFRLYLPVFAITLITTTYVHYGFFEQYREFIDTKENFPGQWHEPKPPMLPTWSEQLWFWAREMFAMTNIISEATVYPYHDQHLWSILSEMRASLHLYGILIALAMCKKQVRLVLLAFMTLMYFLWNHWDIWVYILGAFVAQIDVILTARDQANREVLPTQPDREAASSLDEKPVPQPTISWSLREFPNLGSFRLGRIARFRAPLRSIIRYVAFFVAFYLLSYPIDGDHEYAPGYMWLTKLIPEWMARKDKFYPNFGTALLIFLLARSNPDTSKWRRFLTSPIPMYLGKISFALYLVHGPLMHAFGYMIPHRIAWSAGTQVAEMGDFSWACAIITGWAITLVATLWAADVWNREVENRCVKAVKWLESVCFVK